MGLRQRIGPFGPFTLQPTSCSITKVLGAEYDQRIRDALRDTLIALGANKRHEQRGVAGSQDVEVSELEIRGRSLLVDSETYVGLSVTGDADLVELVATEVAKRLAAKQDGAFE